jgi:hypothetical protein
MITVTTLLLILALVCFIIAASGWPVPRVNLVALGLAFWVAVYLVGALPVRG